MRFCRPTALRSKHDLMLENLALRQLWGTKTRSACLGGSCGRVRNVAIMGWIEYCRPTGRCASLSMTPAAGI